MARRFIFVASLVSVVLIAILGCDDIALPVGDIDIGGDAGVPLTDMHIIEADQVYPPEGPVGSEISVYGKGVSFPTGFYRVVWSGGAENQFFQAHAASVLVLEVPAGARSGPFGFVVGGRPQDGHEIAGPTPDGFVTYTVRDPGFRVTDENPWIP